MNVELAEINTVTRVGMSTVLHVTVTGEIDDVTAPAFRQVLASAVTIDSSRLELDLTDVTFFACAGVTELFSARHAAAGRLELVGAGQRVRRVLQLLQLDTAFGPDKAAQPAQL